MNEKSSLIILTNYYPYDKGEEYLEYEIDLLCETYDEVVIISTMTSDSSKLTRTVPDKCRVFSANVNLSKLGKAKLFLSGYSKTKRFLEKSGESKLNLNIAQTLYSRYFISRSLATYNKVVEILDSLDAKNAGKISIYSYWLYITATVAALLKEKYFNKKKVFTFSRAHGYDVNEEVSPLNYLPLREYLFKTLDMIYPVSRVKENELKNKYRLYANKVEASYLGVGNSGQSLETRLSMPLNNLIVSVSTVRPLKRVDKILESLILLNKLYPDSTFKWIHFGSGKGIDKLKNQAEQNLPSEMFEFKGHISNSELHKWYSENRPLVFVNISTSEGVPVSIMEACSYAIPIIATDVGGNSEAVIDGVNGNLIDVNTENEEIAKILNQYLTSDSKKYLELSSASYKVWDEKFNKDKVYSDFIEMVHSKN